MRSLLAHALLVVSFACIAACKDNTVNQTNNTTNNFTTIDARGGVVVGPNGVTLEIPPGAVRDPVSFGIKIASVSEPVSGSTIAGEAYEFAPMDLELLVDATISLPVANAFPHDVYAQSSVSGWLDHQMGVMPDEKGFVRFRTAKLARFAAFSRDPGRDFGKRLVASSGSGDMIASFGELFWWKSDAGDGGTIRRIRLDLTAEEQVVYTDTAARAVIAAADSEWVYFHRQAGSTYLGLGRVRRDGSSPQPAWIADAEAKGILNGAPMIAANGFVYQTMKRVEVATGAVTDHAFGGPIFGPWQMNPAERCRQSPDGKRARCGWGEVDFIAGTSEVRTTAAHAVAANATHWFVTPASKPYRIKMEPHGTDTTTDTALEISDPTRNPPPLAAATSTHLYVADCSNVYWIDLASPTIIHTERDVSYNCIGWFHVDEQFAYLTTSSGTVRIELTKLRSPS